MVSAIGAIGRNSCYDYEYIQIIQELYQLGIKPCGNKQADKTRLQIEKAKIVKQIKQRADNVQQAEKTQQTDKTDRTEAMAKAQLEEERLGAKTVGELNKILHGLK